MNWIKEPWPWYISGPLIGLMVPFLYLIANKPFGVSSSLKHICAACMPGKIKFFDYDWKKEIWNVLFVIGIVIGGFISHWFLTNGQPVQISANTYRDLVQLGITNFNSEMPAQIFSWNNLLSIQGFVFIILGGFMVGFGSRYAGGCTSGHAITGMANFQLASLVAVIGFFVGGLAVTYLLYPILLT
jgi:uncharacterized protein